MSSFPSISWFKTTKLSNFFLRCWCFVSLSSVNLLCDWFSFLFWTLRLGVDVFHLFIGAVSFFLLILIPCHTLEFMVVLRVRHLQSVSSWTWWSSGLESNQASSPSPQGLGAWQAADWCLWCLSRELKGELALPWPGWTILGIKCCPAKLLRSQLSRGTTPRKAGPAVTKNHTSILTKRVTVVASPIWKPVISQCNRFNIKRVGQTMSGNLGSHNP